MRLCVCMHGSCCTSISRPKVEQVKAIAEWHISSPKVNLFTSTEAEKQGGNCCAIQEPLTAHLSLSLSCFLYLPRSIHLLFASINTSTSLCLLLLLLGSFHQSQTMEESYRWTHTRVDCNKRKENAGPANVVVL